MAERISLHGESSNSINPNEQEDDENRNANDSITNMIDQSLLIDLNHLSITSIIGNGGHSTVHQGRYKTMEVAIKIIHPGETASMKPTERKEKFVREVMMLSRVKHDNLIRFIGASVEPSMLIVMELMKGGSLKSFLWKIRPRCPDLEQSISFALDICRAMECLHSNGIIHRDLKPANLLLTEDQSKLKLADFGLAREETIEMTCEAGTYKWMAPELYSKEPLKHGEKKHYDHKVDIYSFGIVFWELLTNSTPFKGMTTMQTAFAVVNKNLRPSTDNVPMDLVPLLQSCWAEDSVSRPEFTEIIISLVEFLNTTRNLARTDQPQEVEAQTTEQQQTEGEEDLQGTTHLITDTPGTVVNLTQQSRRRNLSPKTRGCFDKCCLG